MLTTSPLRSVGVNSNIFHVQNELSRNVRHYNYDSSARMKATSFFSFRHTLNFMNTRLVLQMFVYVCSCYVKGSRFTPFIYANVLLEVKLF